MVLGVSILKHFRVVMIKTRVYGALYTACILFFGGSLFFSRVGVCFFYVLYIVTFLEIFLEVFNIIVDE